MIANSKKYKSIGTLFIVAAAVYVLGAIGRCIENAASILHSNDQQFLALAILTAARNCLIVGGSFSLLAWYCMKFHNTGKGKILYFLGLGIFTLWQAHLCYTWAYTNATFQWPGSFKLYSVISMLAAVLFFAVLVLMLVSKWKPGRILSVVEMTAFGGWAVFSVWGGILQYRNTLSLFSLSMPLYVLSFLLFVLDKVLAVMQMLAFFRLWWLEDGNCLFKKTEEEREPAPLNSAQKKCRIWFAVVFAVTILLWCVLTAFVICDISGSGDDIFGDTFTLAYWFMLSTGPLAGLLLVEFALYLWRKRSLRD